jgi:hypothetical protein
MIDDPFLLVMIAAAVVTIAAALLVFWFTGRKDRDGGTGSP